MTDRNLSRTGESRSNRQMGEAPAIGKVSRSPESALGADQHSRSRSRSRKARAQNAHRTLIAWTCFFSVLAFCIIAAVIYSFYKKDRASDSGDGSANVADMSSSFPENKSGSLPTLDQESTKSLVRESLNITDKSQVKDRFIVHSSEAAVISDLAELKETEGDISRIDWLGQIFANGNVHDEVIVFRENKNTESNRVAQLFKGDDGKWRIDYDAYMRTATPSWGKILSRSVDDSVVRVFINAYSYYNGIYSDDRIWQAYSIASPDVDNVIYGYAKRGSRQEKALTRMLGAGGSIPRATIGLHSADGAGERQFEISRVYAEDWSIGAQAYDESF
ncbi:MAG: hypothetical protein ABJQ29_02390 [Luteolibacter sp.]